MRPAPLPAILAITFLASLGTGVMWNGIAFVARQELGWGEQANFALFVVSAGLYTVAAWFAGALVRGVSGWLSPRGVVAAVLAAMGAACAPMALWANAWTLSLAVGVASVAAALLWPIVESYVAGGRHGAPMRAALGWWNVTWTSAVPIAMILMGPLLGAGQGRLAVAALAPLNALALCVLPWLAARPAPHDPESAAAEMSPAYPSLLRSVRALLPLSYVLVGALSPLMPFRLEALAVEASWQAPLTALWTIGRIAVLVLLWLTSFWHGRWSTLALGGSALLGGFALVVLGPSLILLVAGLALFGVGAGVVYYTAIYYALSVGHAEVDAGGTHEALIGMGYTVGPLIGLAAFVAAEGSARQGWLVLGVFAVAALAVGASVRAYLGRAQLGAPP